MRSLKIATEQKAYEVGGKGTPVTNKMVTKVRAEELGCIVSIPATANKLIPESGLVKASINLGRLIKKSGSLTINRTGTKWDWDLQWEYPGDGLGPYGMTLIYEGTSGIMRKHITVPALATTSKGSDKSPHLIPSGIEQYSLTEVEPEEGYEFSN